MPSLSSLDICVGNSFIHLFLFVCFIVYEKLKTCLDSIILKYEARERAYCNGPCCIIFIILSGALYPVEAIRLIRQPSQTFLFSFKWSLCTQCHWSLSAMWLEKLLHKAGRALLKSHALAMGEPGAELLLSLVLHATVFPLGSERLIPSPSELIKPWPVAPQDSHQKQTVALSERWT